MTTPRNLVTVIALIIGLILIVFQLGGVVAVVVGTALVLGFIGWRLTTYHRPAGMEIVTLYFLVVAGLNIHIQEEVLMDFHGAVLRLVGARTHTDPHLFQFVVSGVGVSLHILMGIGLIYRNPVANFYAWFIFVGPGFIEIVHYIFPLLQGGPYGYFPGMYTAWIPVIPGIIAIRRLLAKYRQSPRPAGSSPHHTPITRE
jgi:hypothetical protein